MPVTDVDLPKMADLTGSLPRFTKWLHNFKAAAHVAAGPSFPAGTAAPDADGLVLIDGVVTAWDAAYGLITVNATRTHQNILAAQILRYGKGQVATALDALNPAAPGIGGGIVGIMRAIIREVQGSGAYSADVLGGLGLTPHTAKRTLPMIPSFGPELTLDPSPPHTMVVRYSQEGRAEQSKSKPPGCKGCLLKWKTSGGLSGSMFFQKTPCRMDVGTAATGQQIAIQGTWVMGNNKESPPGNTIVGGVP